MYFAYTTIMNPLPLISWVSEAIQTAPNIYWQFQVATFTSNNKSQPETKEGSCLVITEPKQLIYHQWNLDIMPHIIES